jgi:cell division protein FtsW
VIVFLAGVLMMLGVVMVYSASVTLEEKSFNWRQWWNSPLRQGVFALVGFLAMLVAAHVNYRIFAWERRWSGWRAGLLVVLSIGLLIAVHVPGIGREVLGARRAIVIPGLAFGFQPSEIAKLTLVIWLAALLSRPTAHQPNVTRGAPRGDIRRFRSGFIPAVVSSAALIGLTAIEDYGTAALMGAVMLVLLCVARARWTHLGLLGVLAVVAGVGLIIVKPHRMERIKTFMSEAPDPMGAGYQINQAMLAIGSGGWTGRGLGEGIQKYGYLPQDNNDFILAIICEELGVAGGIFVVVLFFALLWRGWRIATRVPDSFGKLLALGLIMTISLQAAMNIGVVTNSIPTKGISLPFVSAGGSGVVILGVAAGLLAAVGRRGATRGVP